MILVSEVIVDESLVEAARNFDYSVTEGGVHKSSFTVPDFPNIERDGSWGIGLLVGPSGSGKTTILKNRFGITECLEWNPQKAIVSQVDYRKLGAVGLNSVPSWCRPFHVLSNGEQFRARLARILDSNVSIDEFTSVIDRIVAKSSCHAIQRYIRQNNMTGVVFSSCHYDIVEWLQPDWCFDVQTGVLTSRGSLPKREELKVDIFSCSAAMWELFREHHYLDANLNKSARCYLATINGTPVGFASSLPFPSGTLKKAWREHRTVVLPDYQGLGIGVRISDFVGQIFVDSGHRYFSKTAHPRMGEYRNRSPLWRATCKNGKARKDYLTQAPHRRLGRPSNSGRICYSHEYLGKLG